ncbi:hypothetical protein GPECTOR_7g945 [Gonium pectorale]|uniref:UspA domain-containing protein n=1 Tax=Gonium pectorale TaxID=33097 RepID=A0A150GUF6_GONPE|nr:hypothetical protein GPECTOR_7g945 [Gonium pectorale]|eukprot:KXZ53495.1 hypothetical protein GPECTOR_7g945 [Gonium pectorale]
MADEAKGLDATDLEIKKRQGNSLHIAVGVDGSQMSNLAMNTALGLFNSRRGDKFTVIHVSDSSKTYLSKHLQPSHLKNFYTDMAHGARVTAEWLCREKEEGRSTCECLTRLADRHAVDLLVLGSWGRKGEKIDMLGSVSSFSLRQAHASIAIVRSTGSAGLLGGGGGGGGVGLMGHVGGDGVHVAPRPARYLFATDGSHAAHLAFCFLVNYLMRPADRVTVVTVTGTDGASEAKLLSGYSDYMRKHKVTGDVSVKCIDRLSNTVPEGIVEAVADHGCDVLAVGISGYGRKKLGSVSTDISTRASCTTIIIKDSREVVCNRYSTAGMATLAGELTTAPAL